MLPGQQTALLGKRVLLVEDEVLVGMLMEFELHDAGAEVVGPAASVKEALHLIEEAIADRGLNAAVLDIYLDGESVLPVVERLTALGVPFLFATGYIEGCDTRDHPAAPLLHKPFTPKMLITTVAALTARPDDADAERWPGLARAGSQSGSSDTPNPAPWTE